MFVLKSVLHMYIHIERYGVLSHLKVSLGECSCEKFRQIFKFNLIIVVTYTIYNLCAFYYTYTYMYILT